MNGTLGFTRDGVILTIGSNETFDFFFPMQEEKQSEGNLTQQEIDTLFSAISEKLQDADNLTDKINRNFKRRQKQRPKKRSTTSVKFYYKDRSKYTQLGVKHVVVNNEDKCINVSSEKDLGDGLVIRTNSSIPFNLLSFVIVITPQDTFWYKFSRDGEEVDEVIQRFNGSEKFKTRSH